MRFMTCLFLCIFNFTLLAHQINPCQKEKKFLVNVPVLNMYEECSTKTPLESQAIYGHSIFVVEEKDNGWALVESEEGYRGYARIEKLVQDNPRFRTSKKLYKVSSVEGLVYPGPDTEIPAFLHLPFSSRVEVLEDSDSMHYQKVRLIDGTEGWMFKGDLVKREITFSKEQIIQFANKFLERPYVWGGSSSIGFDCSGLTQALYKEYGIMLPRNSRQQIKSEHVYTISREELMPGDLVFLLKKTGPHIGLYLGDNQLLHTGYTLSGTKKAVVEDLDKSVYNYESAVRVKEPVFVSSISPITSQIKEKMIYSWNDDNPVALEDLRFIEVVHWGYDGCIHNGQMIVHRKVAYEVIEIFEELFNQKYPIEKMHLIDSYKAIDELSTEDNNSSAFCSRQVTGKENEWSYHSYGLAIDINPLLNPYHKNSTIVPSNGEEFLERTIDCQGIIDEEDLCYKAFISRGWKWAGDWFKERGYVDFQHFYKEFEGL